MMYNIYDPFVVYKLGPIKVHVWEREGTITCVNINEKKKMYTPRVCRVRQEHMRTELTESEAA